MPITLDDVYAKVVETEGLVRAQIAGTPPPTPPPTGPISISQANELKAERANLSFTFDGTEFTFVQQTPFGNQTWKQPWSGQ